jgi:hypothetical protein
MPGEVTRIENAFITSPAFHCTVSMFVPVSVMTADALSQIAIVSEGVNVPCGYTPFPIVIESVNVHPCVAPIVTLYVPGARTMRVDDIDPSSQTTSGTMGSSDRTTLSLSMPSEHTLIFDALIREVGEAHPIFTMYPSSKPLAVR